MLHSKIMLTHTNKLLEFKELGSCEQGILTVHITLRAIHKINVTASLFHNGLLQVSPYLWLGASPDIYTICCTTFGIDSMNSCWKKINSYEINTQYYAVK